MTHLEPTHLVDVLDGQGTAAMARHLEDCARCREQLASLESTIGALSTGDIPEPSPLYWDHFAARVSARIDEPRGGWTAWLCQPRVAAALTGAVLVFALVLGLRTSRLPFPTTGSAGVSP